MRITLCFGLCWYGIQYYRNTMQRCAYKPRKLINHIYIICHQNSTSTLSPITVTQIKENTMVYGGKWCMIIYGFTPKVTVNRYKDTVTERIHIWMNYKASDCSSFIRETVDTVCRLPLVLVQWQHSPLGITTISLLMNITIEGICKIQEAGYSEIYILTITILSSSEKIINTRIQYSTLVLSLVQQNWRQMVLMEREMYSETDTHTNETVMIKMVPYTLRR